MLVIGTGVACLTLGFFAGLCLFKVKNRWCPLHGTTMRCVDCMAEGVQTFQFFNQRRYRWPLRER